VKNAYQLKLERQIAMIERDLDEQGPSKWLELDRNALLDELREYLNEKTDRERDEKKDEGAR
jgi:hypothetical protein